MKIIKFIYMLLSLLPLVGSLVYYSYIFRAIFGQGFKAFDSDPASLGYQTHNRLVWWSLEYTIYPILVWFTVSICISITPYRKTIIEPKFIKWFLISMGVYIFVLLFDPFHIWFFD